MATDSSTPFGAVAAGSVNAPLFAIRFTAGPSDVKFILSVRDIGSTAGSKNITSMKLYDGANFLGNGIRESSGAYDVYTFDSPVVVAANTSRIFTIKADISSNTTGAVRLQVAGISHNYGTSLNLQGEASGNLISIVSCIMQDTSWTP